MQCPPRDQIDRTAEYLGQLFSRSLDVPRQVAPRNELVENVDVRVLSLLTTRDRTEHIQPSEPVAGTQLRESFQAAAFHRDHASRLATTRHQGRHTRHGQPPERHLRGRPGQAPNPPDPAAGGGGQVNVTDHYTYRVAWSPGDNASVATVIEFPSPSWLDSGRDAALRGLRDETCPRQIHAVMTMRGSSEGIPARRGPGPLRAFVS